MPKYEICVVSKEYRYITVEAETEEDAKDMVWDKIACGFTGDTKPEDTETELYLEGEVSEEEEVPEEIEPARELANKVFGFKGVQA